MRCPVCNEETFTFTTHWRQKHQKTYGYDIAIARFVWDVPKAKEKKCFGKQNCWNVVANKCPVYYACRTEAEVQGRHLIDRKIVVTEKAEK
jgi:hypothetical protein